ncbi:MAG: dihydroneopterin aldolase [Caulobacteraceae bacterium]
MTKPLPYAPGLAAPAVRLDGFRVFVRGLLVQAEIGLYPHERGRVQPLVIDVELELTPAPVAGIADTVNYETLADYAAALAAEGHVDLVETFAERLAHGCLANPRVMRARVRVEKPEALERAQAAGVEILVARAEQ